jgi:hypothetical protein
MVTQEKKSIKNLRSPGISMILISAAISFILAVTVDMSHYELGALVNYIWPPFVGLITIIIFLIVTWITKNQTYRIVAIVLLSIYNLYVGFALHIEKDYWPLVTF